jgi:hypothetical protein
VTASRDPWEAAAGRTVFVGGIHVMEREKLVIRERERELDDRSLVERADRGASLGKMTGVLADLGEAQRDAWSGLHAQKPAPARALTPWPQSSRSDFDEFRVRGLHDTIEALASAPREARQGPTMFRVAERRAATLYRHAVDAGEVAADDPIVDEALVRIGGGHELPAEIRRAMELELGVALGRVRIHTDKVAADAARAVRAEAFTVGEDVFFAAGAFAPSTRQGQKLIAHELTHVVQGWQGRTDKGGGGRRVSNAGESLEVEAEATAERIDRRGLRAHRARSAPREIGQGPGTLARAPGTLAQAPLLAPPSAAPSRGLISRRATPPVAAPIPDSAGGVRLGHDLPLHDSWVAELKPLIKARQFGDIDRKVDDWLKTSSPRTGHASDPFIRVVPSAVIDVGSALASSGRADDMLERLYTDLAAVTVDRVQNTPTDKNLDVTALSSDIEKVSKTYVRFAEILRDNAAGPIRTDAAANAGKESLFSDRARTFVETALAKLGTGTPHTSRVFEGLAADVDRFRTGEDNAPVSGGQLLVEQLLGDDAKNVTALGELYRKVIEDVRRYALGETAELLRQVSASLDALILAPITAAVAQASDVPRLRTWLARECGEYLARLEPDHAADQTLAHLKRFGATFVVGYGVGPGTVPAEITDQAKRAKDEHKREADRRQEEQTRGQHHDAPAQGKAPAPAHKCTVYPGYTSADIAAWLRSYFTDRKQFDAKRFDLGELQCTFAPNAHQGVPAEAVQNLAAFRAGATRMLAALAKEVDKARARDAQIAKLRGRPPSQMPDYVGMFAADRSFYTLLTRVVDNRLIDTDDAEDNIAHQALRHFFDLATYQNALTSALQLIARGSRDGLDRFLSDRHADSYNVDLVELRKIAGELPAWPATSDYLDQGETLVSRAHRLETIFGRADVDRNAEHASEVEQEIYKRLPVVLETLWAKIDKGSERPIYLDETWTLLKPRLSTLRAGDDKLAQGVVQAALIDANKGRLDRTAQSAAMSAFGGDTLRAEQQAARAKELGSILSEDAQAATIDKVEAFARGETQNLVSLFTMGEASLSGTAGNWGDIMRAANLLRIAMQKGKVTLHSATDYLLTGDHQLEITADLHGAKEYEKGQGPISKIFWQGTDKELLHGLQQGMGHDATVSRAFEVIKESRQSGALQMLLAAEVAGGGMSRKQALAKLAERLDKKGGAQAYASAKFIYAYILDCVHLLDKGVRDSIEHPEGEKEESRLYYAGKVGKAAAAAKKPAPKKPPPPTLMSRSDAVKQLDAGKNPVTKKDLVAQEKDWWSRYKAISGEDNIILPGKQGWSEIGEFVKQLVAMLVLTWVSGGLAAGAAEMFALGETAEFLVNVGMFTEAMRFTEEMKTGQVSENSFAHDFVVNLAMMRVSELVVGGFGKLIGKPTTMLGKVAFTAGEFAAEYAAVNAVGLVDLAATKGIGNITADDLKQAAIYNFAFIVSMKGAAVLGSGASAMVDHAFKEKAVAGGDALLAKLRGIDKQLAEHLDRSFANEKDSQKQSDALDKQASLIEQKAAILESSKLEGAKELAQQYRKAVALYRGDVARAKTLSAVRARPVDGTPHFTYEAGGGHEAELAAHFTEAGITYEVRDGLGGKIIDVMTPEGRVTFTPREPGGGAASTGAAYANEGRIERKRLSTDKDVMKVLAESSATHPAIVKGDKTTFKMNNAAAPTMITIVAVDSHTINSPHNTGPAAMEIKFKSGTFEVRIEIERNSSNDHVVRSINHEMAELSQFLERAVEEGHASGKGLALFNDAAKLRDLVRAEAAPSAVKKGAKPGEPSSHDVGLIEGDVRTLGLQLNEISSKLRDPATKRRDVAVLEERLDLMRRDLRRVWNLLDLPEDKASLDKRLAVFEKAGIKLSKESVSQLQTMRAGHGEAADVSPRIGPIEIQMCFDQLKQANPKLVKTATYNDLMEYYQDKIRGKAEAAMKKSMAKYHDKARALKDGLAVVKELAGGTSVASWRGRAFEGLSIKEFNDDPALVAERGRMHQIELNNFPTYDAATVKGVGGELVFTVTGDKRLRIDVKEGGNKRRIFEQKPGNKPPYVADGVDVWLVSMKAKGSMDIKEMTKALGTPDNPTEQGLLVTPEYMRDLRIAVKDARKEVATTKAAVAAGTAKPAELADARERLKTLEFFEENIEVSKQWSNEKIDELLVRVKAAGVDTRTLKKDVRKAAP